MRRSWTQRILVFALLLGAAVALRFTVFRTAPIPVTVFRVAPGRVEETVTNSRAGTIQSRRRATLSTEVGGRVAKLPVKKGDRVRTGQVLVVLAHADVEAQVAQQGRALDAARADERQAARSAEQAERELDRYNRLARDLVVSREVVDQYESGRDVAAAARDAAAARVRQAAAVLDAARAALDKTVLRAPFDGVVADLKTEIGEWITPSPPGLPIPPVLEVIDTDAIYVSAPMDEVDVARVRAGRPVRITMDAFPGRSLPGRVTRVAPYVLDVQEQNRTFEIEAEFDDAAFSRTLLPGTSADVEVVLDARDPVLRIPSYALIEGGRVLSVRDGRLVALKVRTGLRNWEFVEIREGLAPGEAVAVSLDRAEIREGAEVRIAGETLK
ncbi:MAG: efflux RND transporter periplasmic adaptor subunit [Acidobacteriia bacterium]|nr:efflux RND transporter periplasmic adaptor subunit [Terriglobia bacterium]